MLEHAVVGSGRAGFMSMDEPDHTQAAPAMMMTTSGLKSLEESHEEQQINQDLRYSSNRNNR